jgi:hypothetical protein
MERTATSQSPARTAWLSRLRPHGLAGAALIAVFWPAAWLHLGALGAYAFFPLWLGYILVVDQLVLLRSGSSLLTRSPWRWAALFALSAPFWWAFEFYNSEILPRPNWIYVYGPEGFAGVPPAVWKTICFSTVIPAVLETLELIGGALGVAAPPGGPPVRPRNQALIAGLGALFLALAVLQGAWAFGLIWLGPAALLDVLNYRLGRRSVIATLAAGDARLLLALVIAGPLTGFFWELWNAYASPKWLYVLPAVLGPRLFEMPLLGYLGYTSFAAEIYALANLVWAVPAGVPADRFATEETRAAVASPAPAADAPG